MALLVAPRNQMACQTNQPSPLAGSDSTDLINPDRPGIADGSRVILAAQWQIEVGAQRERRRINGSIRSTTTFAPLLIRFGVTDRFEARVESNSLTSKVTSDEQSPVARATGYSPVSIGAKYQIYDSHGDNRRSLGLIARLFPPSGSGDYRTDRATGDVRLAADWDFASRLSLNPNVGIARQEDDAGRAFTAGLGALTLTYAPTDWFTPFVDMGAQFPEASAGAAAIIVDSGLCYIIGQDIQLDVSAGRGVHGSTPPRPFIAVGISIRHR